MEEEKTISREDASKKPLGVLDTEKELAKEIVKTEKKVEEGKITQKQADKKIDKEVNEEVQKVSEVKKLGKKGAIVNAKNLSISLGYIGAFWNSKYQDSNGTYWA